MDRQFSADQHREEWQHRHGVHVSAAAVASVFVVVVLITVAVALLISVLTSSWLSAFLVMLTVVLFVQSASVSYAMLYTRLDRLRMSEVHPPKRFLPARYSFTVIIPARHEENVIYQTIHSMSRIKYPEQLFKLIVVVRSDDTKTHAAVDAALDELRMRGFAKQSFNDGPANKPHALNVGLAHASSDVIAVFDAEDEPHSDILNIVNTVMLQTQADVVQSGVQLTNVDSHWFSALNALEYFFWFSSILPCLFSHQVTPLAGNSVFFRTETLRAVGGWDETCLTEDVEIGIRLAALGADSAIVYHPESATQEETPPDVISFIRQRTRWFQGYLQVLARGVWLAIPSLRQRYLTFYVLLQPCMHIFILAGLVSMTMLSVKAVVPVGVALFTFIPGYMLALQIALRLFALKELKAAFRLSFSRRLYIHLIVSYLPYQIILCYSAFRAIVRMILRRDEWEKTPHQNAHRPGMARSLG